ncbi:MAG TPA: ATP-binding protein [Roseiflexaceae bacterium]|nr:ATP-binding protein [Roseiflexaceae bacterium]
MQENDPQAVESAFFPLNTSVELAARINAFDWSTTSLGPSQEWSQSLRTSLSIMLGSRFPMQLLWGPDYIHFYNDAYLPIAGDKHPGALGRPGAEIWPEIWADVVQPMLDKVRTTGEATWSSDQLLVLDRWGFLEEGYYTFSYGPVPGAGGAVEGIFIAVTETTRQVLSERRLRTIRDLGAVLASVNSESELWQAARPALAAAAADLPFALIHTLDAQRRSLGLACVVGLSPDHSAVPALLPLDQEESSPWPCAEVIARGLPMPVHNLAVFARDLPCGAWGVPSSTALVLPLRPSSAAQPLGCLTVGISPRLALDADYQDFLERLAALISGALVRARDYADTQAAVRIRDDFLSVAAHELKTPLTPIIGRLQLLQRRLTLEGVDQRHLQSVATVVGEALRLSAMVDALLDLSRLRGGHLRLERRPLDLRAVAQRIADEVQPGLSKHELNVSLSDQPALVEGDALRLEQVVRNLVQNAIKYSPDGGEVALGVAAENGQLLLTVRDQGLGIPQEALAHLFERYYRVGGSETSSIGGLGVGLFVVNEIVRMHGGVVTVDSIQGQGSTFTVWLPSLVNSPSAG